MVSLSDEKFDNLIEQSFKGATPGSAKMKTKQVSINEGRIQTGEAKLRELRKDIANQLQIPENKIQISIIKNGGKFDNSSQAPLSFDFYRN